MIPNQVRSDHKLNPGRDIGRAKALLAPDLHICLSVHTWRPDH